MTYTPRIAQRIAAEIYAAAESRRVDEESRAAARTPRLRMSSIGQCQRKLLAGLLGVPSERPFPGRMLVLFELGNAIEDHVVRLLKQAGFDVEATEQCLGTQFRHTLLAERLVGHSDGRIMSRESVPEKLLLEIKSANRAKFEELTSGIGYEAWNPGYGDQLQIYMGSAGLSQSLAVVYCKDTSEIYPEVIRFDADRYALLVSKAERVLAAFDAGKLIARPREAKSQFCKFCKWCDVNEWCWSAAREVEFDA